MHQYSSPAAFRAAVDSRLRNRARRLGVAAYIVRRHAALERLVARLMKAAPGQWALKGGLGWKPDWAIMRARRWIWTRITRKALRLRVKTCSAPSPKT